MSINQRAIPVLHESIVDRNDKDLTSTVKLVAQHVAGDVVIRAARRESSRNADDEAFARSEQLGEIDLVARRVLEDLDAGNGIADFNLECYENISLSRAL